MRACGWDVGELEEVALSDSGAERRGSASGQRCMCGGRQSVGVWKVT